MSTAALSHEATAAEHRANEVLRQVTADAADTKSKRGWILGMFFIILVSLLWAAGSVIVQHVADDIGYNQPFVFTFIGSGVMTLFVPSYLLSSLLGLAHNPSIREESGEHTGDGGLIYRELEAADEDQEADEDHLLGAGGIGDEDGDGTAGKRSGRAGVLTAASIVVAGSTTGIARNPMRSHLFMLKIGLSLSVVWFFTNWTYCASLGYTSVTSSTIISNSSALFTYLFNVAARTERFTTTKTAGVFLALAGAVLVGLGDKGDENASEDSLWGDASALASAVGYGIYSTILTLKSPSDDEVSMSLVLGYMGMANLLIFLPLLVVLALLPGVHVLQGLTFHIVQLLVLKSVMDNGVSELLWARAILLTTPTVATVGCSLTIPIAFASDFALHGKVPNALAVSGALLVVGGFYFVSGREGGGGARGAGSGCRAFRRRICCLRRRRALSEGCCSPSSCAAPPFVSAEDNHGHVQ